jgi:hypothetical protein
MNTQKLLLDRIEFDTVKIETVIGHKFDGNEVFPQLNFDFSKIDILTRSSLSYSDDELEDPRHFALRYGVKIDADQSHDLKVPYLIEIEATGYLRYTGDNEFVGEDRFRAVRFSGYQLLYGAIREMAANITARSRHGLLQLPARTFGVVAKNRSVEDEAERLERIRVKNSNKKKALPKKASNKVSVKANNKTVAKVTPVSRKRVLPSE